MTRQNRVLALVIGGVIVIVGLAAGVAAMGWWLVREVQITADPTPSAEADKRLIVTAADIARVGGPAVDPKAETWSSLRQGNGNRFIMYLYEPKGEPRFSLYSRLVILPTSADAQQMYAMDNAMTKLGSADGSYVPAPGLFPDSGDASAWFIEKDGEKIGSDFLIREGRLLNSVRIIGLTLHTPEDVQALLGPVLNEMKNRVKTPLNGSVERRASARRRIVSAG